MDSDAASTDQKDKESEKDKEKDNSLSEKEDDQMDADGGQDSDDKDLHPLEMPRLDSDNTDSNDSGKEGEPAARIEDNNLLGESYFDVKSDHCLMPLLP